MPRHPFVAEPASQRKNEATNTMAARARKARRLIGGILLVTAAVGCGGDPRPPAATTPAAEDDPRLVAPTLTAPAVTVQGVTVQGVTVQGVTVQGVIDNRTFLLSDGVQVRVRGLAAPDECWAATAAAFAKAMLLDKPVTVGLDADETGVGTLTMADEWPGGFRTDVTIGNDTRCRTA